MPKQQDLASYYFHQGTNYRAYEYLGVHLTFTEDGRRRYVFRTWAPNADRVALISDFTDWNEGIPFRRITDRGIYELFFESDTSLEHSAYKFRLTKGGISHNKGDPYARFSKGGADGASVVYCESAYTWGDDAWFSHRRRSVLPEEGEYLTSPLNIYEVHLASFMRKDDGGYYTYREMADILPSYVKSMGYTHVEFLPLAEYPFDGSWGYQVCGFYAPTSRFGEPKDFAAMIDAFHRAGVGVLLDWVPAHFPKDEWGLYEFDGAPLYEYQGRDRMESRSWGTRFFDLGREEVQCFLVSNARYFLKEFHIDGLRVDAVASMLYLDYDRLPGEWLPNAKGGRENLEAIAFLQKLNAAVLGEFPDALMIAEESTAFPGVTHPVATGGLGFSLKWNMGFANDFYAYLSRDPVYRKYHHSALNFPLMYAFSENYILPVSHDEVVHGKRSFVDKMYGSYEDKFREARAALLLMMTYPGKKMLFMGTEFAQFREWDFASSLEWFMLDYPKHRSFREYTAALNRFYLSRPELYERDFSPEGFEWVLADESEKNLVAYRRFDRRGNSLICIVSFSGARETVTLPIRAPYIPECLFHTDADPDFAKKISVAWGKDGCFATLTLSAFSGVILKEKNGKRKIGIQDKLTV